MSELRIAILLLNYNGHRHLKAFFARASFLREFACVETVLIDNGSADDSLDFVRNHYPWVRIIRNADNYGWGEGYNRGIMALEKEGARYTHYLFLNNDVYPSQSWLEKLIECAREAPPSVGEIGCRTVFAQPFVVETPFYWPVERTKDIHMLDLYADGHSDLRRHSTPQGGAIEVRLTPRETSLPEAIAELVEADAGCSKTPWSLSLIWNRDQNLPIGLQVAAHLRLEKLAQREGEHPVWRLSRANESQTLPREEGPILAANSMALIYRQYEPDEPVQLIQNSGVGLNRQFEGFDQHVYQPSDTAQDVEQTKGVCGVCKLVVREAFHAIGGFDPQYFMYYEDLDFSLRLSRAGYESSIVADAILPHVHGGSSETGSPFFNRQVAWSLLYFHFKHGSAGRRLKTWMRYHVQAWVEGRQRSYEKGHPHRMALTAFADTFDESFLVGLGRIQ